MVSNCCLCFDLKYGYYTYIILTVGLRMSFLCFMYITIYYSCTSDRVVCGNMISMLGGVLGWFFASVWYSFLVIAGIFKESSMLLYPCIVILIMELLASTLLILLLTFIATPYMAIALIGPFSVYGYDICCLISLYKNIKKAEIANTGFRFSNEHNDI